mmetsp:Transcript_14987/g.35286  ORF Transcript_14987/g.35286 Transcript_14987/m.35286 type:complete len:211 (+) Transcript_14987:286-918(+)
MILALTIARPTLAPRARARVLPQSSRLASVRSQTWILGAALEGTTAMMTGGTRVSVRQLGVATTRSTATSSTVLWACASSRRSGPFAPKSNSTDVSSVGFRTSAATSVKSRAAAGGQTTRVHQSASTALSIGDPSTPRFAQPTIVCASRLALMVFRRRNASRVVDVGMKKPTFRRRTLQSRSTAATCQPPVESAGGLRLPIARTALPSRT